MGFDRKVAPVTGGATRIGAAASEIFVSEGARVGVVDLKEGRATEVARAINNGGGNAIGIGYDVSNHEQAEAAV